MKELDLYDQIRQLLIDGNAERAKEILESNPEFGKTSDDIIGSLAVWNTRTVCDLDISLLLIERKEDMDLDWHFTVWAAGMGELADWSKIEKKLLKVQK